MSIYDSIRSQFVPITPEGYPFIGAFAFVSIILFWLWAPLGWLGTSRDNLVRLFLPRSAKGNPGARWPGHRAGRRTGKPGHQRGTAAGAEHRQQAAAADLDLHERVRLPRESQSGSRQDRENHLSTRQVPQRRPRQGQRGQRAQFTGDRDRRCACRRCANCRSRRQAHCLLRRRWGKPSTPASASA